MSKENLQAIPDKPQEINSEQKRNFFIALGLRYRKYFAKHIEAGHTSRDGGDGDKPKMETYTNASLNEQFTRKARWGDVAQHCMVEAAVAEIFADIAGLPQSDKDILVGAAFLHDSRKREEVMEKKKGVPVEESYEESSEELRQSGLDYAAEISELTGYVAHTSLPLFAELNADNTISLKDDATLTQLFMHYIDDITKGSELVDLDERMDYLDKAARDGLYGYNDEGKAVWGGRTYFEAQREIAHLIEVRLAQALGVEDPRSLPAFFKEKLTEKINSFKVEPEEIA